MDRDRSRETGEDSSEGSENEQFEASGKEGIGGIAAVRGSGNRRGRPTNLETLRKAQNTGARELFDRWQQMMSTTSSDGELSEGEEKRKREEGGEEGEKGKESKKSRIKKKTPERDRRD